jgi:RNA polymerase sigma factor (sigma-70 family)
MQPTFNTPEATRSTLTPQRQRELVTQSLAMVRSLAAEIARAYGLSSLVDDLESCGRCGLLQAVEAFDDRPNVKFTTFAYYRIRGAILDAARHWITYDRLTVVDHQLAEYVVDAPPTGGTDLASLLDEPRLIRKALATLPALERRLVEHLYFEAGTFASAAAELGRDRSWLCRLHVRALAQLRRALTPHDANPTVTKGHQS